MVFQQAMVMVLEELCAGVDHVPVCDWFLQYSQQEQISGLCGT